MNKKRIIISIIIILLAGILYGVFRYLTNTETDYISWFGGIVFFALGQVLSEWCSNE